VERGQPLVIDDAANHPLVSGNLAIEHLGVRAYLGIPLKTPEGHVLGSLCAIAGKARRWSETDVRALEDITGLVMTEIALRRETEYRKEAQQRIELLNRELQHRIKNTIATIQGIIQLSLRTSDNLDSFSRVINERLLALSRTHTYLSTQPPGAVEVRGAILAEITPYLARNNLTAEGPMVDVAAEVGTAVPLMVHELTTNAVKHGALLHETGSVSLLWTASGTEGGAAIHLSWEEKGGPVVTPPTRSGFGSLLLNRLAHQLGGHSSLEFRPEGLRYTAMIPCWP